MKIYTKTTHALFLATNSIFYILIKFLDAPELQSLNLKLCSKKYNEIFVLHLIVVPQLSSGWQHNYSTKTSQAGHANWQSMYSIVSMAKILKRERFRTTCLKTAKSNLKCPGPTRLDFWQVRGRMLCRTPLRRWVLLQAL